MCVIVCARVLCDLVRACVCDRVCNLVRMYAHACECMWSCVCVYLHQYAEVALPAEGSVPITTFGAGGTTFTRAAKPKSNTTAYTSVMRLGFNIVGRVRVGVGERVGAGAMTAPK
jgi:hypothetical protein